MATLWIHEGGSLHPASKATRAEAEKLAQGERVTIEIKRGRSLKFHRMFFALLNLCADAVNAGPASTNASELLDWIKLKTGHFDVVELPPHMAKAAGMTHMVKTRSISFARMDEAGFHSFVDRAVSLIADELAPHVRHAPEWPEIRAMVASIRPEVAA